MTRQVNTVSEWDEYYKSGLCSFRLCRGETDGVKRKDPDVSCRFTVISVEDGVQDERSLGSGVVYASDFSRGSGGPMCGGKRSMWVPERVTKYHNRVVPTMGPPVARAWTSRREGGKDSTEGSEEGRSDLPWVESQGHQG